MLYGTNSEKVKVNLLVHTAAATIYCKTDVLGVFSNLVQEVKAV